MMKNHTKSKNTVFRFRDIEIHYNLPNTADVYYLTNNNVYNKEVNQFMLDLWYKRLWLHKSDWLVELHLWFEYAWHWKYYRDDELYLADKERRENIRKAPILLGNDINGD